MYQPVLSFLSSQVTTWNSIFMFALMWTLCALNDFAREHFKMPLRKKCRLITPRGKCSNVISQTHKHIKKSLSPGSQQNATNGEKTHWCAWIGRHFLTLLLFVEHWALKEKIIFKHEWLHCVMLLLYTCYDHVITVKRSCSCLCSHIAPGEEERGSELLDIHRF